MSNQKIIYIKIFYTNGSSRKYNINTIFRAPKKHVQIIMMYLNEKDGLGRSKRLSSSGNDYYWFKDGKFGTSFNDINKVPENSILFYGEWTTEKNYEKILSIAMEDYSG